MASGAWMKVQKTIDNSGKLVDRVNALAAADVLVGIPQERAPRRGESINSASLAYIHEHGSPVNNIPARPFMRPGVRAAMPKIRPLWRQAANEALTGNGNVRQTLNKIGMIARNEVVKAITTPNPPFVPLKPETVRARLRKTQAGRRQLQRIKQGAVQQGITMGAALHNWATTIDPAGNPNIRPLIDTGQLRAAITYVVRGM